jgi:hypothetical protein
MAYDEAIAFGSPEGVSEHLVRDLAEGVIELLVPTTSF